MRRKRLCYCAIRFRRRDDHICRRCRTHAETDPEHTLRGKRRNNNAATVSRYDGSLIINQWHALYVVRAQQTGNYIVSYAGYLDLPADLSYPPEPAPSQPLSQGPTTGLTLVRAGIIVLIITASRRSKPTVQQPYGNAYPYPPVPGSSVPGGHRAVMHRLLLPDGASGRLCNQFADLNDVARLCVRGLDGHSSAFAVL